jgi:ABC-type sugar transport system substrate-binding protein
MAQVAKAAVTAGIAWAIVNTDVDYVSQLRQHALVPVFSILSDHAAIGKIQGQQIAAFLGDAGCVLYLEGPSVRDVAKVRTKGMLSTKPPQVNVKTLKGDWTQNSGYPFWAVKPLRSGSGYKACLFVEATAKSNLSWI